MIVPACIVLQVPHLVQTATASAAGDVLSGIANAINTGIRWIVTNTATWWVAIPSPDLTTEPAITQIQAWLLPVTAAIAAGGVIAAGARMAITRRASPLLDVTGGLLTLAAVATLGVAIPALLLKAGDAWSAWILQVSTGGQFIQRLTVTLQLGGNVAPAVVMVFGIIAILLSLVQAVLMLFRQAALVILAGVLPLAAAGTVAPMTRTWIRKVTSWMLALICYKPAAAAVYAAAFTMIGSGGSPRTMLMGFVMLLLSVVTLPALMKFFTWTTGSISGTGGGQLLGAAAMGAIAVGTMRGSPGGGGGGPAQDQAAYLSSRLGSPPGGGPPSAPAGPISPPGPPTSPSGAASAGPASTASPATGTTSSAPTGATASTAGGAASSPAATAAPGGTAATPTGAASTGSAATAAGTGAVTGAAAGPAGVVAAGSAEAAAAAARLATGAVESEDSP